MRHETSELTMEVLFGLGLRVIPGKDEEMNDDFINGHVFACALNKGHKHNQCCVCCWSSTKTAWGVSKQLALSIMFLNLLLA